LRRIRRRCRIPKRCCSCWQARHQMRSRRGTKPHLGARRLNSRPATPAWPKDRRTSIR
jgi:hypothetical protein